MVGFWGCLPASSPVQVLVKAAAFGGLQPQARPHCFSLSFPVVTTSVVIIADDLGKTVLLRRSKPSPTQPSSSPLPRASPAPSLGAPQVAGVLCLWDGKEEGWKLNPALPVLTRCPARSAQAWRLLANAEGRLLPCFPTTFCCFASNLCLRPITTVLAKGINLYVPLAAGWCHWGKKLPGRGSFICTSTDHVHPCCLAHAG